MTNFMFFYRAPYHASFTRSYASWTISKATCGLTTSSASSWTTISRILLIPARVSWACRDASRNQTHPARIHDEWLGVTVIGKGYLANVLYSKGPTYKLVLICSTIIGCISTTLLHAMLPLVFQLRLKIYQSDIPTRLWYVWPHQLLCFHDC